MEPTVANRARLRRVAWGFGLIAAGVLAAIAWILGPDYLEYLWIQLPYGFRRRAASLYLDVLIVGYAIAMIGAIALIAGVLLLRRFRRDDDPGRRRRHVRLLATGGAILLCLLAMDLGAAGWGRYQQRLPQLPEHIGLSDDESTADESLPVPDPRADAPDALTILVIGESTARGEPYHPWLSVGQIVAWQLESIFPGRPIRVDVRAKGGHTIKMAHEQLSSVKYRPDALILLSGHNEFAKRFPWMREPGGYYEDEMPSLYSPAALQSLLRFSPMCRLAMETWDHTRVELRPPRFATRELVDQPSYRPEEYNAILEDFRRRLDATADYCEAIGTLPIFIAPASNDGGYDPSRSSLTPETPRAERQAFARDVKRARSLEESDPDAAFRLYQELVERHPEFAETHFRLGRMCQRRGDWAEARRHQIEARNHDGLPLRCTEDFRIAYRELAERRPSVILVDVQNVFEALDEHGILDDRLFHDAQHPNLRGYVAMAQDLLDRLCVRKAFGWPEGTPSPTIDIDACARHFGLDAERWAIVCGRCAVFYDITAYIRWDPAFRLERAADYRRAEAAIQSGRDRFEAGIPGMSSSRKP